MVALNVFFAMVIMTFILFAAWVVILFLHNADLDKMKKDRFNKQNTKESQNADHQYHH